MLQTLKRFTQKIPMGAVASVFAHAIILALLVFGLPQLTLEPEEPQAIQVQLVLPEEDVPQEQEQEQEQEQQSSEPVDEATTDTEETASVDQEDVQPPQIIRLVYQFGEKDAGPSKSADGETLSEEETDASPSTEEPAQEPDTPEQTVDVLEAPAGETIAAPTPGDEPPTPEENTQTARSLHDNESPVATTAMGALPRGIRAGELCVTELRRQLLGSLPPFWPDLLPTYRLDEGTILQVRKGAFRSKALWYNLRFRCQIDEAVTSVVSFELDVGSPIPRAEWPSRGLPAS